MRISAGGFSGLAAATALAMVFGMGSARAETTTTQYHCTNTFSGTKWVVVVDYARQTADTAPATITDDSVRWQDPTNGVLHSLDRKSGVLVTTYMSSVGGYLQHDRCQAN